MSFLYAIIRVNNSDNLQLIRQYLDNGNTSPTETELLEYFNYATSLSEPYSSDLPFITKDNNGNYKRLLQASIKERRDAYTMQVMSQEMRNRYDIVALSHRYGGFTHIDWNFNEDISFHIYTNFGYGVVSVFNSTYKYKGIILAPYSYYVKYKNSTYASVIKCTNSYKLEYSEWERVMNDCLYFYNAIVSGSEHFIFNWITSHLTQMVSGLENFLKKDSYDFFLCSDNNSHISSMATVTGDDFWIVKSTKIANCLYFINNIKELPQQIDINSFITRLINVCKEFKPSLCEKISLTQTKVNAEKNNYERLCQSGDYPLYIKLRDKYLLRWCSNKFKTIWFLMHYYKRYQPNYDYKQLRIRIETVLQLVKDVAIALQNLRNIEYFLKTLEDNLQTMNSLLLENQNYSV